MIEGRPGEISDERVSQVLTDGGEDEEGKNVSSNVGSVETVYFLQAAVSKLLMFW